MPMTLSRRTLLASAFMSVSPLALAQPKPATKPAGPRKLFAAQEIVTLAENLSKSPYIAPKKGVDTLSFDQYRDIRYKPDRAVSLGAFKLQTFHTGFIYKEAITLHQIKDGVALPLPHRAGDYDYGKTLVKEGAQAGFRLHYPLNEPKNHDELISFLGASYFRFLGRGQVYGLSARGLAINSGEKTPEEFPRFREFWLERGETSIIIHALLDSPSLTGAYRFTLYPADQTVMDVNVTLFARAKVAKLGLAPLTSMFMKAENDKRVAGDFRPELHDSDGLLIHGSSGEWLYRPLRNPVTVETSAFLDKSFRGFGLIQRDRTFEHYQDLDLNYEHRPTYWVEPREGFGAGRVELIELPTPDETNDNIVAYFVSDKSLEAGQSLSFSYRITSTLKEASLHPGTKAINTFKTKAAALGSGEVAAKNTIRFIVDFAGGDLEYYLKNPELVQIVPTCDNGKIIRSFLIANKQIKGFRAAFDIEGLAGKTANLRAFLKAGDKTLSETWTVPWLVE
jgi:periplasmic glucans biosynthesis protein